MSIQEIPTSLPRQFYRFFWDVDPTKVNPAQKPYFVINRLLDKGNVEAARWVLNNFPRETIVDTFRRMRDFSFDVATFWSRYLNFPLEEAKCMQEPWHSLRKQLWPY